MRYWEFQSSNKVSWMRLLKYHKICTIKKGCVRLVCNITSEFSMHFIVQKNFAWFRVLYLLPTRLNVGTQFWNIFIQLSNYMSQLSKKYINWLCRLNTSWVILKVGSFFGTPCISIFFNFQWHDLHLGTVNKNQCRSRWHQKCFQDPNNWRMWTLHVEW